MLHIVFVTYRVYANDGANGISWQKTIFHDLRQSLINVNVLFANEVKTTDVESSKKNEISISSTKHCSKFPNSSARINLSPYWQCFYPQISF